MGSFGSTSYVTSVYKVSRLYNQDTQIAYTMSAWFVRQCNVPITLLTDETTCIRSDMLSYSN